MDDATIAALSTPPGRGGLAVIRISGPATGSILLKIIAGLPGELVSHRAYHGYVHKGDQRIEECVVVFFKGPNSFTGEDVAEISIHGNPFMVEEVLDLIFQQQARGALPGEFTYRAFKNGKMDLIQAESINELIHANSRYHALMKFGSLEGKLSQLVKDIRTRLKDLAIKIETKIEFEEDQYLEPLQIDEELQDSMKMVRQILENSRFNEILDRGIKVVIVGKANVGKSSLFNTLLLEERSITSPSPGTTRDFIKEKKYIDGLPVELMDVAGMNRQVRDDVEKQGIERSLEGIKTSDAVIFMTDAATGLEDSDQEIYGLVRGKKLLIVINKMDVAIPQKVAGISEEFKSDTIIKISVQERQNISLVDDFLKSVVAQFKWQGEIPLVNHRQRNVLLRLQNYLIRVVEQVEGGIRESEIIAEDIRQALYAIGELTGEVTTEEILAKIFADFCVGK